MISWSVLVAKAGRWGWLLLLSGSQVQVGAARPLAAAGLSVGRCVRHPSGVSRSSGHWLAASARNPT